MLSGFAEMTHVYELIVYLHEGENISLGLYSSYERAYEVLDEELEEWSGPNVFELDIIKREVKD